ALPRGDEDAARSFRDDLARRFGAGTDRVEILFGEEAPGDAPGRSDERARDDRIAQGGGSEPCETREEGGSRVGPTSAGHGDGGAAELREAERAIVRMGHGDGRQGSRNTDVGRIRDGSTT